MMLSAIADRFRSDVALWRNVRLEDVLFSQRTTALVGVALLGAAAVTMLLWRHRRRQSRRDRVGVPAMLVAPPPSVLSMVRHGAWFVFVAGIPFFALALAAPYTRVAQQRVSYPGRRIAVMIDASSSMMANFNASRLTVANAPNRSVFFTTIAAAEAFVRQRMSGKYRDVIALIEFGDEAYVVTPFTTDYANVLLSASLIGDWTEFQQFPNTGTTIANAIDEAVRLFKAFSFTDAAGNMMVIFSDGQDTQVTAGGKTVTDVLSQARASAIPIYFIRCGLNRQLGDVIPDAIWKPAVESTGGRFYAAANEQDVLRAIRDIDMRGTGRISLSSYAVIETITTPFVLAAAGLWSLATALKLTVRFFTKFP